MTDNELAAIRLLLDAAQALRRLPATVNPQGPPAHQLAAWLEDIALALLAEIVHRR